MLRGTERKLSVSDDISPTPRLLDPLTDDDSLFNLESTLCRCASFENENQTTGSLFLEASSLAEYLPAVPLCLPREMCSLVTGSIELNWCRHWSNTLTCFNRALRESANCRFNTTSVTLVTSFSPVSDDTSDLLLVICYTVRLGSSWVSRISTFGCRQEREPRRSWQENLSKVRLLLNDCITTVDLKWKKITVELSSTCEIDYWWWWLLLLQKIV